MIPLSTVATLRVRRPLSIITPDSYRRADLVNLDPNFDRRVRHKSTHRGFAPSRDIGPSRNGAVFQCRYPVRYPARRRVFVIYLVWLFCMKALFTITILWGLPSRIWRTLP